MKVYVFLTEGFETVEALGTVDLLRRAKIEVVTVSTIGKKMVTTSNGISVIADALFEECNYSDGDMIFLPGGPGTPNLLKCSDLEKVVIEYNEQKKYIGAICAAPSVLGNYGILQGKHVTCYPGYENQLKGAECTGEATVVDGHIITGKGMGKTIETGLAIIETLLDKETADSIRASIQY